MGMGLGVSCPTSPGARISCSGGRSEDYNRGRQEFRFHYVDVDHVILQSTGGANTLDVLQLPCAACASVKRDRTKE